MDPLRPETPEGMTVPVRRVTGQAPAPSALPPAAADNTQIPPAPPETPQPLETRTVSLRAGGSPAPLPASPAGGDNASVPEGQTVSLRRSGSDPVSTLAPAPSSAQPMDSTTVSIRTIQKARQPVEEVRRTAPAEPSDLAHGAAVSIREIMQMRAQMKSAEEAPPAKEQVLEPAPPPEPRLPIHAVTLPPAPIGAQAPSVPETAPADPATLCPHCGTKLISPESLGMCPSCGFCRSLEEGRDKVPVVKKPEQRVSLFGLVEFLQLFAWVPAWCWVMVGGFGMVALVAVYARRVTENSPSGREWWGLVLIGVGLLGLISSHLWALLRVAADNERMAPWDLLYLSLRVWRLVIQRLPSTSWPLVLAGWSGAAIVASLAVAGSPFGGLSGGDGAVAKELRQAMANLKRSDYRSLTSTAASDLKSNPTSATRSDSESAADRRSTEQCVIIGFQVDDQGRPTGLILATLRDGTLHYAGVVRDGIRRQGGALLERLNLVEKEDGPAGSDNVRWVKPEVGVEVHHSGVGERGTLQDPNVKRLLTGKEE